MKLRLLMFFGLLTSLFVSVQAQTSSNEVAFLDEQGRVIPSNTTVVLNKVEQDILTSGGNKITGKVYIQNRADKPLNVSLSYTVNDIDEGDVQVCAYGNCTFHSEAGTYKLGSKLFPVGLDKEFVELNHSYGESEVCTVTLKLTTKESGSEEEKEGPTITVKFDTKATGIASASSQNGGTYDVFNVWGILLHKQLTSLSELPKGVYIVKQKDAKGIVSTRKYIVR
ncbi:T9SS C-terminal target domain-containing protein [Prevotella multiformis]|uniref:T9SS C-terminal target domain-containing protein n=1 Tax=Prevotella multiformis TaxID=282402 RepID=UPI0028DCD24C|nr:T9SS C-terminal target domain-containing protein [Prevotella multiformis]